MRTTKRFQKNQEDFICEKCGSAIQGNGYTNHCPNCLWSKHVDTNPGDRLSICCGIMKPIGIELKNGEYTIIHQCIRCGLKKKNKTAKNDNFDAILKISSENT